MLWPLSAPAEFLDALAPPELSAAARLTHLILLFGASLAAHVAARLADSSESESPLRRIEVLTLLQAAGSGLRLVTSLFGSLTWTPLVALYSLLDVGLLALLVIELQQLVKRGGVTRWPAIMSIATALTALFCAFLGGAQHQPLLVRNLWAAVGQIGVFAWLNVALLRTLRVSLRAQRQEAVTTVRELQEAADRLGQQADHLRGELQLVRDQLADEITISDTLRGRLRTLERILSVAVKLHSKRSLSELLESVVQGVADVLGYRRVTLYLFSDSTKAFEARAFAGVADVEKAGLTGIQVAPELFVALTDARYRHGGCYLVENLQTVTEDAHGNGGPAEQPQAGGPWQSAYRLIAPLPGPTGETRGFLAVYEPVAGTVPELADVQQLTFLVRQAAAAIESAEVHDRLAHNNRELVRASKNLKSLGEMKANFVANVSHELRTPLTSISAYAELLRLNGDTMTAEMRDDFLKIINRESGKLTQIIDDILELSRIEEGRGRVARVTTDLAALAKHLEDSWQARADEQDTDFVVETSATSIELVLDPLLLQQLFGHLLSNAFKFTPPGGTIRVVLRDLGRLVQIVVEDTGIGIPERQLDAIFEQFYQVDGSSTREHNGQGVGLAICQDIVSTHDGHIWAENVSPHGARFIVALPRRPTVLQPVAAAQPYAASCDTTHFMRRLMHWISESLSIQMATLMVPDESGEYLIIRAAIGLPETVVQSCRVRRGTGIAGKVWVAGRTLLVDDVTSDPRFAGMDSDPRYSTPSLLSVPLVDGLDVIGVLTVNNRTDGRPLSEDDQLLLESLMPQITYLLRCYQEHDAATRGFAAVQEALRATAAVACLRDTDLVAVCHEICLATARRIGLPAGEQEHLAFALQYYDVGMSRVPATIVRRRGPLDADQWLEVREHVSHGLALLAPLRPASKVRQIILHHHENYDGSGYPEGLAGEAIPLGARLLRLTDSLFAMLQTRPYRSARTVDQALAELRAGVGRQYCPRLTDLFVAESERRRDRFAAAVPESTPARPVVAEPSEVVQVLQV